MQKQKNQDTKADRDDDDTGGEVYSKNLQGSKAEKQVRENEDASLQDDSYSFDSDNTGNEDIHDVSDFEVGPEEDHIP